ncbi:hypothetical protein EV715DRAFT_190734 [Schizophyllum commune]
MSMSAQMVIDAEEQLSLLSVKSVQPSPDTLTKLVKRLRTLTLTLLPVEVDPASIIEPTSRTITPAVIGAYRAAAGDFVEALPYCLLRCRSQFIRDANSNPADYDENYGRAIACEVLARRIVHLSPPDRIRVVMSTRFRHLESDGDESDMSSALELAIDTNCTIFLSSSEAQDVIMALWRGELVQQNNEQHDIDYVPYSETREATFWGHFHASRLSVPRFQNMFRIFIWLFFLLAYSQAVREPLEKLHSESMPLDEWEVVLYVFAVSFCLEGNVNPYPSCLRATDSFFKLLRFATWRAFTFWNVVAIITDALLVTALALRIMSLTLEGDKMVAVRVRTFQVLSYAAPLLWCLITVFDGYKYIGTMQICVARMLQESGIFFALLSVLALGFAQGLYAVDAADGQVEDPSTVVNVLVQALLQSPNYEIFEHSPASLWLYYLWNVVTAVVLLNVLISLFSSAYEDVIDNAEAQYLAFFSAKTVGMIRAPDHYVYPPPTNLIEIFFIAPFELLGLSKERYAKLNRIVMSALFCVPLALIALYESGSIVKKNQWMKDWLAGPDAIDDESPEARDPQVDDEEGIISKVPFEELIKVFPNTRQSSEATILKEVDELRKKLDLILQRLDPASSGSTLRTQAQ